MIFICSCIYIHIDNIYTYAVTYIALPVANCSPLSPYRMRIRCSICCRALPAWDTHNFCLQHRRCTKLQPCDTCALWPARLWSLLEAWRQENLPCIRTPVLAPVVPPAPSGAEQPVCNAMPSASLRDATPAPPGTALELHASGESDWASGEEPSRQWRPIHESETSQPSPGQRGPAREKDTGEDAPAAGLTTQLQGAPEVSAPSGRPPPPTDQAIQEAGNPHGPTVLRSDTPLAARPLTKPPVLQQQYQSPLPSMPTAPTSAPQHWYGGLPGDVPLSAPRHATKRPAPQESSSESSPESIPKRKKKKKDKRGKQVTAAKQTKGKGKSKGKGKGKGKAKLPLKPADKKGAQDVSDSDLYQLMATVAQRHGWFTGPIAPGAAPQAAPLAAPAAPVMAPPPAPPAARSHRAIPQSRAPAALGAPPGEESFPPHAPAPMQGLHTVTDDSASVTGSEWSSSLGRSRGDSDILSVSSGAPSAFEQEAPPGLRRLGDEAEALLLRYLGEFYSVTTETPESQAQPSMLFRSGAEPDMGIPLTPDFKREYERIAKEAPPRGTAPFLSRAFLFREEDTTRFLASEKLSPELLALGEHMGIANPLRRRQYTEEDKRWDTMARLCRSSMKLSAYAGALANLAVQADQLGVSAEDRSLLDSLQLSISELLWKQATRAAFFTTRRRRDLALSALGFSDHQRTQLARDVPFTGPYLFSGQFTPKIKEELAVRQQARELAGQLRKAKRPGARYASQPRFAPRQQAAPARGAAAAAAPQRGRGTRSSRGRNPKGKHRGQRGQSPAAQGRGGF